MRKNINKNMKLMRFVVLLRTKKSGKNSLEMKWLSNQCPPVPIPVYLLCAICKGIHRNAVTLKMLFYIVLKECICQQLAIDFILCPICGFEVSREKIVATEGIRKLVNEHLRLCVL